MPRVRNSLQIGQLLAEQRRKLGLTQEELARSLGVSRQWVLAVEKGKPRAELETVLRALGELGLDVFVEPLEPQR